MTRLSNTPQLTSFYDRWERFEEARRDISEDLKELFAEGKGNGYNPKAMRIAFAERYRQQHENSDKRAKREQQSEEVELYLAALAGVPVRAREIIEEIPPEIAADDQSTAARKDARQAPERLDALAGFGTAPPDKQIPEQPEAAHGLEPHRAGTQAPPVDTIQEPGSEGLADAGREVTLQGPAPEPIPPVGTGHSPDPNAEPVDEVVAPAVASSAPIQEPLDSGLTDAVPVAASVAAPVAPDPLRLAGDEDPPFPGSFKNSHGAWRMEGCQKPDVCAGMWNRRCGSCQKAFVASHPVTDGAPA